MSLGTKGKCSRGSKSEGEFSKYSFVDGRDLCKACADWEVSVFPRVVMERSRGLFMDNKGFCKGTLGEHEVSKEP